MDSRVSRQFAPYRPDARTVDSPLGHELVVRRASPHDAPVLGALSAEREGGDPAARAEAFARIARQPDAPLCDRVWVAEWRGQVIAYGKVHYFTPPADAPVDAAPEGWYLAGVVVAPEFRRRGVGSRLTRERLSWIARRASRALYFASAMNRASIDLHERLGFREVTRSFWYPGAEFTGGVGILFECGFPPPPDHRQE